MFPGPAPPLVSGLTFQTHCPVFLPHHLPSDYQGNDQCAASTASLPADQTQLCSVWKSTWCQLWACSFFRRADTKNLIAKCSLLASDPEDGTWLQTVQAQARSFLKGGGLSAGTSRVVQEMFELGQCRNPWDCEKELCHSLPSWRENSKDDRQE